VVPWDLLDAVCAALGAGAGAGAGDTGDQKAARRPAFFELVAEAGGFVAPPPPERKRPKELEERLARLRAELEDRQYRGLVRDVTEAEEAAAALREGGLNTYKDQLSFGLHVIVTMFTLFTLFYVMARSVTRSEVLRLLAGLAGATAALLMETTLLITRTTYSKRDRVTFEKKYR
jgi:hypothetical protein